MNQVLSQSAARKPASTQNHAQPVQAAKSIYSHGETPSQPGKETPAVVSVQLDDAASPETKLPVEANPSDNAEASSAAASTDVQPHLATMPASTATASETDQVQGTPKAQPLDKSTYDSAHTDNDSASTETSALASGQADSHASSPDVPILTKAKWQNIETTARRAFVALNWANSAWPQDAVEAASFADEYGATTMILTQELVQLLQQLLTDYMLDLSLDMETLFRTGLMSVYKAHLRGRADCSALLEVMLRRLPLDSKLIPAKQFENSAQRLSLVHACSAFLVRYCCQSACSTLLACANTSM